MPSPISLIVTVYNRAAYLPLTLDSILCQTHPQFELLIWDDGSSDNSLAIAQTYAQRDSRIRVIAAVHQGIARSLRGAIAATTAPYLCWVDSDDLLAPTALEETAHILDTHPDVGLVYTNHLLIDERGQDQGLGRQCRIPYTKDRLLVDFMVMHFRLLRRDVYNQVGGIDLTFDLSEDYDLCLKLSEITDIYHLPRPLYYYRRHPGNITRNQIEVIRSAHQAISHALERRELNQHYQLKVTPTFSLHPYPHVSELPTAPLQPFPPPTLPPLISIIIPAYNAAPRLRQSLQSCINQTYPNLEILLVDNGSSDNTVEIAQTLAQTTSRPVQILHCPERGTNAARNYGFTHAQGDYIQWLDADDELAPDKLDRQLIALIQQPDADIAYGDWEWCFWEERHRIAQLRFSDRPYDDIILQLLLDNWRPPHAYLLRRRAATRLHHLQAWNPDTRIEMNREYFTLAALLGFHFLHVPDSFVRYHQWSPNQISRQATRPDRVHNRRQIFRRFQDVAQLNQGTTLTPSHQFLLQQTWDLWQPTFTLLQQNDTFTLQPTQSLETFPLTWQEVNIARALLQAPSPRAIEDHARKIIQLLWREILVELQQAGAALDFNRIADELAWRIGCADTPAQAMDPPLQTPAADSTPLHPLLLEVPLFTPLLGEERLIIQQFLERLRQRNGLAPIDPSTANQSSRMGSQSPLNAVTIAASKPFKSHPRGVLYCAVSNPQYLAAALTSAIALHQLDPDVPITLLTDFSHLAHLGLEQFNITIKRIEISDEWRQPQALESRLIKTRLSALTDYEQTLYLDADILPLQSIAPIWDYLAPAKIGLVIDLMPTIAQCNHISEIEKGYMLQHYPGTLLQFNSGMMLWETSLTASALFSSWEQEWLRFKQQDQLALVRAIEATRTEITVLPNLYNFPISELTADVLRHNQVRLLHCFGELVPRKQYQRVAQKLVPDVVKTVQELLSGQSAAIRT